MTDDSYRDSLERQQLTSIYELLRADAVLNDTGIFGDHARITEYEPDYVAARIACTRDLAQWQDQTRALRAKKQELERLRDEISDEEDRLAAEQERLAGQRALLDIMPIVKKRRIGEKI